MYLGWLKRRAHGMNFNDDFQKITALMPSRFDLFYLKTDATSKIIINLLIISSECFICPHDVF
jgi:hypothetical protein